MSKKIYIRTFGCQMNARDTEMIYSMLIKRGYSIAGNVKEADVVLFNTCSVRKHAEERVWGQMGMLRVPPKFADANLNRGDIRPTKKIIGLIGCMAQSYKEKIFKRLPHLNLVCGTGNIYEIGDFIDQLSKRERERILAVDKEQRQDDLNGNCTSYRQDAIKAYVSIMQGCDNFCSYCIVPYVRGRERSRRLDKVLSEVGMLADEGFKEVTLLGQNVNSYRSSLSMRSGQNKEIGFIKLLEEIDKIKGIQRVRFMTSHPKDVSQNLFEAMRDLPTLCEHLHLPLQSGSDKILKLMNRGYRASDYLKLVESLRKIIPRVSITTDIIVGFPGETKADFEKTQKALKEIEFDGAFIFKYSPRPPAASSRLKDDVAEEEREQRNQILLELQGEVSREKNQRLIGSLEEVIVEPRPKKGKPLQLMGRTRTNKIVVFKEENDLIGKLVRVKIERVTPHTLIGVIDNES